jgi:uncharacterized protein YjiS (DUF1127 family)
MTSAACCAPTLVSAIPALPATPPMPRVAPGVVRIRDAGPIRLYRPAWSRLRMAIVEAWTKWRASAREGAELRALAALDRHLLRDVGLDDRVPPFASPTWQAIERARW